MHRCYTLILIFISSTLPAMYRYDPNGNLITFDPATGIPMVIPRMPPEQVSFISHMAEMYRNQYGIQFVNGVPVQFQPVEEWIPKKGDYNEPVQDIAPSTDTQEDQEVGAITSSMSDMTIAAENHPTIAHSQEPNWADLSDDDVMPPVPWANSNANKQNSPTPPMDPVQQILAGEAARKHKKPLNSSTQTAVGKEQDLILQSMDGATSSESSANTPSTSLHSSAASHSVPTYLEIAQKKPESVNYSTDNAEMNSGRVTVDEKLAQAVCHVTDMQTAQRLKDLVAVKLDWINKQHKGLRNRELLAVYARFETAPVLSKEIAEHDTVTALLDMGKILVTNADGKIGLMNGDMGKQFARLGKTYLARARESKRATPRDQQKITQLMQIADGMLPTRKKKLVDQTNMSEAAFRDGYSDANATAQIRSDGVILHTVISAPGDEESPDDEALKKVKKKKAQKEPQQSDQKKEPTSKPFVKKAKKQKGKQPAQTTQQEKSDILQARIEKILAQGDVKQVLALYEQIVDGKIPLESDENHEFKIKAARAAAGYYAQGGPRNAPIKKDFARARYFAEKAIEYGSALALADLIQIAFAQRDRSTISQCCDQLSSHPEATDFTKHCVDCFRAIEHLMYSDGEIEDTVGPLSVFSTVLDAHTFYTSTKDLVEVLPRPFFDWMHDRLHNWQDELDKEHQAGLVIGANDVRIQWLYLMGRMVTEGNEALYSKYGYKALNWLATAADLGSHKAQLLLSSCNGDIRSLRCIAYLERAFNNRGQMNEREQDYFSCLIYDYARDGFLSPLCIALSAQVQAGHPLDKALHDLKLEQGFPSIAMGNTHGQEYNSANIRGLIDPLKQHAQCQEGWISRAILSALEIAQLRHGAIGSMPVDQVEKRAENALTRIAGDVSRHPQLKSILGAGHAALAEVLASTLVTPGNQPIDKSRARKAVTNFEQAVQLGDSYGILAYAKLILMNPTCFKAFKQPETRAIKLLEELAEGDSPNAQDAILQLMKYYGKNSRWYLARKYLEQARDHLTRFHEFTPDKEKEFNRLRASFDAEGEETPSPKQDDRQKEIDFNRQVIAMEQCLLKAQRCARKEPFKALKFFEQARKGYRELLGRNAHALVQYLMILDDLGAAAADDDLHPKLKSALGARLESCRDEFAQLYGKYKKAATQPGYEYEPNEELMQHYFKVRQNYHRALGICNIEDADAQVQQASELINELISNSPDEAKKAEWELKRQQVPDHLLLGTVCQVTKNALDKARTGCNVIFDNFASIFLHEVALQSSQESTQSTSSTASASSMQSQDIDQSVDDETARSAVNYLSLAYQMAYLNPEKAVECLKQSTENGIDGLFARNPWLLEQYRLAIQGLSFHGEQMPAEDVTHWSEKVAPFIGNLNAAQKTQDESPELDQGIKAVFARYALAQRYLAQMRGFKTKESIIERYHGALLYLIK